MLAQIQETAQWIKAHTSLRPNTAIVLGTGLGRLAEEIEVIEKFPYADIPNFPVSTVEGHSGCLIFGRLGNKEVLAMQGRFHYYEGYDMKQVTFPIRVMHELGIKTLFRFQRFRRGQPRFCHWRSNVYHRPHQFLPRTSTSWQELPHWSPFS